MSNITNSVIGKFVGKCCQADKQNKNQMTLSRELFENLISSQEYQTALELGHYIGMLGHPEDPGCQDYKDACIVMRSMEMTPDGDVNGTFDLIDTPVGRIVKTFIEAGVTFGISIRGAGDVDSNGDVDPETFVFRGFDLVTFPAYDDAIPTFTQIAASSDIEAQKKYKKICASIETELPKIEAKEALDIISECVSSKSDIKDKVEARKAELEGTPDEDIIEVTIPDEDDEVLGNLDKEKVRCMTDLYIEACSKIDDLTTKLDNVTAQLREVKCSADRKIKALERMNKEQIDNMECVLSSTETEKSQLNKMNLRYNQKIERQKAQISEKDSIISSLQVKLDETVRKLNNETEKSSNLDETNKNLQKEITASTKLIEEYQDAYAYLYSKAVGVSSKNISINASTSVKDLQKLVCGTSTANVSSVSVEPQPVEILEDISDAEDELVSL